MKNLNELQEQRAALVAEREQLIDRQPELEAAWETAPRAYNHLGHMISTPESVAAMDAASSATARIHCITSAIEASGGKGLDAQIAYLERLAKADEALATANTEGTAATAQATRLAASQQLVMERLASLQSEVQQGKAAAQQAEQSAAQAIAIATASGDSKAEKAAQAMMSAAIESARQAEAKERQNQAVTSALEAEADALATQLGSAQKRADAATTAAQNAVRLKLHAEWNAAVEALALVGERLTAIGERFTGYGGASALSVPVFGPVGRALTAGDLAHRAKEKAA
jgi:hypothetical protein